MKEVARGCVAARPITVVPKINTDFVDLVQGRFGPFRAGQEMKLPLWAVLRLPENKAKAFLPSLQGLGDGRASNVWHRAALVDGGGQAEGDLCRGAQQATGVLALTEVGMCCRDVTCQCLETACTKQSTCAERHYMEIAYALLPRAKAAKFRKVMLTLAFGRSSEGRRSIASRLFCCCGRSSQPGSKI